MTVTDPRLVGQAYSCTEAAISNLDGSTLFDKAAAPRPLTVSLELPATKNRGRRAQGRLTVANTGSTATAPLTLTIKRTRGLSAKPRRFRLAALPPGASKTVRTSLRLARSVRKARFVATVTGGGLTVTKRTTLRVR